MLVMAVLTSLATVTLAKSVLSTKPLPIIKSFSANKISALIIIIFIYGVSYTKSQVPTVKQAVSSVTSNKKDTRTNAQAFSVISNLKPLNKKVASADPIISHRRDANPISPFLVSSSKSFKKKISSKQLKATMQSLVMMENSHTRAVPQIAALLETMEDPSILEDELMDLAENLMGPNNKQGKVKYLSSLKNFRKSESQNIFVDRIKKALQQDNIDYLEKTSGRWATNVPKKRLRHVKNKNNADNKVYPFTELSGRRQQRMKLMDAEEVVKKPYVNNTNIVSRSTLLFMEPTIFYSSSSKAHKTRKSLSKWPSTERAVATSISSATFLQMRDQSSQTKISDATHLNKSHSDTKTSDDMTSQMATTLNTPSGFEIKASKNQKKLERFVKFVNRNRALLRQFIDMKHKENAGAKTGPDIGSHFPVMRASEKKLRPMRLDLAPAIGRKIDLLRGRYMFCMMSPESCDTFVALPPLTKNGAVVFGKNSDRPQNEVQEVILVRGGQRNSTLMCTYITIDESPAPVNTVVLSKPAWMWGAEMGANDKNVVIGNEAVWTNYNEGDGDARVKRLLGMDLVRLGLERGGTAQEALKVITALLEKYGQGGPCSDNDDSHFYHNSFLIADPEEAWVLETSGRLWAAEKVENGYRNISNGLTITTKIDKHSDNLHDKTKALGLWDGQCEFNFTKCFSSGGDEFRQREGEKLLKQGTAKSNFDVKDMIKILRHKESNICRGCDDTFPTQGSQVSSLSAKHLNVHWFTATPDPSLSYFKPFVFTPNAKISPYTKSPMEPKREHYLYRLHMQHVLRGANSDQMSKVLLEIEQECHKEVSDFIQKYGAGQAALADLDTLMKNCVETEVKLYG